MLKGNRKLKRKEKNNDFNHELEYNKLKNLINQKKDINIDIANRVLLFVIENKESEEVEMIYN